MEGAAITGSLALFSVAFCQQRGARVEGPIGSKVLGWWLFLVVNELHKVEI